MIADRGRVWGSGKVLAISFLVAALSGLDARADGPPVEGEWVRCFLKTDAGLLVVRRAWTRRLDLPGGRILAGETAEKAVERGTLAETGVAVVAGPVLDRRAGTAILRCTPSLGPITLLPGWSEKWAGRIGYRMPVPLPARDQVEEAGIVDLYDAGKGAPKLWSSPSRHELLVRLAAEETAPVGYSVVLSVEERASELERGEIGVIRRFQAWGSSQTVLHVFRFFSLLGEEAFYYLWIPLLFLGGFKRSRFKESWTLGARLTLLLCVTALVNGLLKKALLCSRPLDWVPSVQWASADGYGFPSGHTQLATAFFGYLAWALPLPSVGWRLAVVAPAILTGIARIYLGVHFPHDVLGGWFISGLLVAGFVFLERKGALAAALRTNVRSWGGLGLVSVVSFALRPHPDTLAALAVWIGVLAGIQGGKAARAALKAPANPAEWLMRGALGAGGIFFIVFFFSRLAPSERSTGVMAFHRFVEYAAVGLWLSWGSFWAWLRAFGGGGGRRNKGRASAVAD